MAKEVYISELRPHRKYLVRGMEMFFWRYREDETPEFYHYQKYVDTRHIIYFWDKDLRRCDIKAHEGPLIPDFLAVQNQD